MVLAQAQVFLRPWGRWRKAFGRQESGPGWFQGQRQQVGCGEQTGQEGGSLALSSPPTSLLVSWHSGGKFSEVAVHIALPDTVPAFTTVTKPDGKAKARVWGRLTAYPNRRQSLRWNCCFVVYETNASRGIWSHQVWTTEKGQKLSGPRAARMLGGKMVVTQTTAEPLSISKVRISAHQGNFTPLRKSKSSRWAPSANKGGGLHQAWTSMFHPQDPHYRR